MRLMLALDFVIPISSTSLPAGNLVDGLPPAHSFLGRQQSSFNMMKKIGNFSIKSFDILIFLTIQSASN